MFFVMALALAAVQPASTAPSFDCSKGETPVERAICKDAGLAAADALMARLYGDVRVSAFGKGTSNQPAIQREWLKDRESCARPNPDNLKSCLEYVYAERNRQLAVAALYSNPAGAIEALRKIDSEFAPLAEAIVLYSNESPGTDWLSPSLARKREQLVGLLRPYQRKFEQDTMLSYGRDILDGEGIKTAEDAIRNEKSFAHFVQIASAYFREGPTPRSMPCGAILRHPALLDATASVFGSTLDNFIVYPDCDEMLPPLPRLSALVDRINAGWPDCEGTIRFSAYRSFVYAISEARLAMASDVSAKTPRMPRLKGVPTAQVEAAIKELTAYYVANDRAPVSPAPKLARQKIFAIMASGQYCP